MKTNNSLTTFVTLLKREYWEHRGSFLKMPLYVGLSLIALFTVSYIITGDLQNDIVGNSYYEAKGSEKEVIFFVLNLPWIMLYHFLLMIVIFSFVSSTLFNERKDGSILFWKSLPISNAQVVFSKLVTACLVVPVIFTLVFVVISALVVAVFFLLTQTQVGLSGQIDFNNISILSYFFDSFSLFVIGCGVQMLLALPIYGWLLLCSSFTKKAPFLTALILPLISLWVVGLLQEKFNINVIPFSADDVGMYAAHLFIPTALNSKDIYMDPASIRFDYLLQQTDVISVNVLYGIAFAIVTTLLAVRIRRYRNTL